MKIGIIGAGHIGGVLTRRLTQLGHDVTVANSRGPETLTDLAAETGARAGRLTHASGATAEAVDTLLAERGVEVVMYSGWQLIDEAECSRGAPLGRPRVKLAHWDELLDAARRPVS